MEKTTIIGHLGRNAEVAEHNGRKAINFNIAVNRTYKKADGTKQSSTNWYSCTRWLGQNESGEVVKYLLKGTQVYVEGSLQPSLYKTKDNQTAVDLKLNVKVIQLLGSKTESQQSATGQTVSATAAQAETGSGMQPNTNFALDTDDDLPF
jgi:single-strand DNA-binding protein